MNALCPRCSGPIIFRDCELLPGRICECPNCKIAGHGDTDQAAWEFLDFFESKAKTIIEKIPDQIPSS